MTWEFLWGQVIFPGLMSVLTAAACAVAAQLWQLLKGWLATQKHNKASAIVIDAIIGAGERLKPAFLLAAADGKITGEEWAGIRKLAKDIAASRLKDLRGFSTERLGDWLEQQIDIGLGKLTGSLLGIEVDTGSKVPESLANSRAVGS